MWPRAGCPRANRCRAGGSWSGRSALMQLASCHSSINKVLAILALEKEN